MKKILSLLIACAMMMSLTIIAGAEAPAVTLSVGDYDATEVADNYTEIKVPITIDAFPVNDVASFTIVFDITNVENFDGEMYGFGMSFVADGDIKVGSGTLSAVPPAPVLNAAKVGQWTPSDWANFQTGEFPVTYLSQAATTRYSNYMKGDNNVLFYLSLYKANGAAGTSKISIKSYEIGDTSGNKVEITPTLNAGTITFTKEPVVTETTVKTFAKRLYLDNTLYTVGVISEGTNYATETIKAGIRIDKAGVMVPYWTNNAPVSDGKGTSYYAVALNGVTAETDIKAESVSKAVITVNGGAEISGDEVSANDTSVE